MTLALTFCLSQDSVRLLAVEDLIVIAELLSPEENAEHVLQVLKTMCGDKSWRVRYMVADKFVALSKAVGQDMAREELLAAYVRLLRDSEAEVRTAASTQVPGGFWCISIWDQGKQLLTTSTLETRTGFSQSISYDAIIQNILPCVKDLATDQSQHVRAALATHISGLAPLLGKQT